MLRKSEIIVFLSALRNFGDVLGVGARWGMRGISYELCINEGLFIKLRSHSKDSGGRVIFFKRKDCIPSLLLLSKQSWRNSFAMKRCGEG